MTRALALVSLFVLTNASLLVLLRFSLERLLLTTLLYAGGTALMIVILFHPRNHFLLESQTEVDCPGRPCVALTFDDGPSPDVTPRVLDILSAKGARATFFVVGRQAERHPELLRRARDEGHVIGNHTYSHPPLFCFLTPQRLRAEIERAQQVIVEAAGVRPRYFRSPVGLRHPLLKVALERLDLAFVLWRLRSWDTRPSTAEALRQRILSRVRPGSIVLLHDRRGPGSAAMLEALPEVIDGLRARGYEIVAV